MDYMIGIVITLNTYVYRVKECSNLKYLGFLIPMLTISLPLQEIWDFNGNLLTEIKLG